MRTKTLTKFKSQVLTLVLTIAALAAGHTTAWAQETTGQLLGNATDGYYVNMPKSNTVDTAPTINLSTDLGVGVTSIKVYDDGGIDGKYSNNCDAYLIITSTQGCKIKVYGSVNTQTDLAQWYDYLEVFDVSANKNLFKVDGNSSIDETSTGNTIRIHFHSNEAMVYDGFEITVTLLDQVTNYSITRANVEGGTFTTSVSGSAVTQTTMDQTVTVNATPASGYYLNGVNVGIDGSSLTVPVADGDFISRTATFTMPPANVTVTPTFTSDATSLFLRMPVSGSESRTIPSGITSFKLYDDGGAEGNYSKNCDGTLTLTAPTNCVLQLTGSMEYDNGWGSLKVYNGANTSSATIPRESNTAMGNAVITTGQYMTIRFAGGSFSHSGLDLTVTVIDKTPRAITVTNPASGGTVTASVSSATVNTEVTLTAIPVSGYKLAHLSVTDTNGNPVAVNWDGSFDNTATFKMPGSVVTVTPTFTNDMTAEGGVFVNMPVTGTTTLDASDLASIQSFKLYDDGGVSDVFSPGANGTLTLTAPEGCKLRIEGTILTRTTDALCIYDGVNTSAATIVDAVHSVSSEALKSVSAASTGQSLTVVFSTNNNTPTYSGLDFVVSIFNASQSFDISKAVSITGGDINIIVGASAATTAHPGETVTVSATPSEGYIFNGITVTDGNSKHVMTDGAWYSSNTATFIMPNSSVTVTPVFSLNEYAVYVPGGGRNRSISFSSSISSLKINGFDGGSSTSGTLNLTAPDNHVIRLTGSAVFQFVGTASGGSSLAISYGTGSPYRYTVGQENGTYSNTLTSSGTEMQVRIETNNHTVTPDLVATAGHNIGVKTDIEHGTIAIDKNFAADGETVTVTATPAAGYRVGRISYYNVGGGSQLFFVGDVLLTGGVYSFTMPANVLANILVNATFVGENTEFTVTLTGGAHATASGGSTTQANLTGPMETVTYTANLGYHFGPFGGGPLYGIHTKWINETTVTVSGTPTSNVNETVPNAEANTYTVAFDGNGATNGSMSGQAFTYDAAQNLTACGYTKEGYSFVGWNTVATPTNENPGIAYTDAQSVQNLSAENGATITLYALWKKLLTNADVTIADIPSQEYTGSALTPVVTITDGSTELTKDTHYTVTLPEGGCTNTGNYTITLTGIGNYDGTTTKTFTINAKVTDYGALDVSQDENGTTATIDGSETGTINITSDVTVDNVSLSRTFTASEAATLMLPFAIDVANTSGAAFYTYTGVTYNDTKQKWEATMTQVTSGTIAANTPYVVMPTDAAITFTGSVTLNTTGGGGQQTTNGDWTFKGTYEEKTWTADDCGNDYGFAATSGKATDGVTDVNAGDFVKLAAGAWIRPMRAYLTYTGTGNPWAAPKHRAGTELPQSISVVLVNSDGTTTEIETTNFTNYTNSDVWFTLDGRKLDKQPTTKGLYIVNGKKTVIK